MSCLPSAAHGRVSLQDLASDMKDPPSIKPLLPLSLTLGSFFGLEAGQVQGLQACVCVGWGWGLQGGVAQRMTATEKATL